MDQTYRIRPDIMKPPSRAVILWLCATIAAGVGGCVPSMSSPGTSLSGVVTLDREPLAGAVIAIVPLRLQGDDGRILEPLRQIADGDGSYRIDATHWASGSVHPDALIPVMILVSRRRQEQPAGQDPAGNVTAPEQGRPPAPAGGLARGGTSSGENIEPGIDPRWRWPDYARSLAASRDLAFVQAGPEQVPAHYNVDTILKYTVQLGSENRIDLALTSVDPWIPREPALR